MQAAERQRSGDGGKRARSEREDDHVVLDRVSVREHGELLVRPHPGEPTVAQLGAGGIDEPREREAAHLADVERLGHCERPVDELVLRCDQLDRDLLRRERLQRERGLEPGNSGSGDDDVSATVVHCARCFHRVPPGGIRSKYGFSFRGCSSSPLGSALTPSSVP